MSACVKSGEYEKAIDVFQQMKQETLVTPNIITYSVLIFAFGKLQRLDSAFEAFNEVKSRGIDPTVDCYNAIMLACNLCNRPELVEGILTEMEAENLVPDEFTHTARIPMSEYLDETAKAQELEKMQMDAFHHFSKMKMLWE
jgi:pentatricopeptide repeat protein